MKVLNIAVVMLAVSLFSAGCSKATYPKEKLEGSVAELCKKEYKLDIDVDVAGTTLAIYLPLPNLFDINLSLSEDAQEKVQDVLLSASRVVLSTDANIKFYCVVAQDVRLPEIQLIIIKYVDDVKRAFYYNISREEYFKRTLIDINENPQAKKEQAIVDVFQKMKLDNGTQEKVLDDFFRSTPSSLEGMGYWQGKFYIKDIALEEFLAQQIANRVKLHFREDKKLLKYTIKSVAGKFDTENEKRFFLISFNAESLLFILDSAEKNKMEREVFTNIFEVASNVIYGYKFENFDFIKITEEVSQRKLVVPMGDIYLFKRRKIGIDAIVAGLN